MLSGDDNSLFSFAVGHIMDVTKAVIKFKLGCNKFYYWRKWQIILYLYERIVFRDTFLPPGNLCLANFREQKTQNIHFVIWLTQIQLILKYLLLVFSRLRSTADIWAGRLGRTIGRLLFTLLARSLPYLRQLVCQALWRLATQRGGQLCSHRRTSTFAKQPWRSVSHFCFDFQFQ